MKQSLPPKLPHPKLEAYQALVSRYHKTLDLVSPAALESLPILIEEALSYAELAPTVRPLRWLDLGSGAGLPAIPLAISQPQVSFTLVERRRRRAAFLQLVRTQLDLDNVTIVVSDLADYQAPQKDDGSQGFEVMSAQAVGSYAALYQLARHLLKPGASIIVRKGPDWQRELPELESLLSPAKPVIRELELARHGRLVSVKLPGDAPCPSSG